MPPSSAEPGSRRAVREAARQRDARRSAGISAVSTVVVLGLLATLILTSSGWPDVRRTFFSWEAFKDSFPDVLGGFWLDIRLFLICEVAILVLALLVALARISTRPGLFPLKALAIAFVDIFRGIPTVLLIYLFGFGIPALALKGVPTDPVVLGGFALVLNYSAYVSEVYRAGIESVHPSQRAAGLALGLTEVQSLRFVVVPQAVRRVLPALLNDFISLQKDVALVSILGPLEAFRQAQIYASSNFNYTPLLAAMLLYLAVTFPLARILDRIQARQRLALAQGTPA